METLNLKITGVAPLLMHSPTLADPLHPNSRQYRSLTSKRNKTDEELWTLAEMDFKHSVYFDEVCGVYLPSQNFFASFVDGAKRNRNGQNLKRGTLILDPYCPLEYDGPDTVDGLWGDPNFRDARQVVVTQKRIMRYRPIFREWATSLTLYFDPTVLSLDEIQQACINAGRLEGVGDYRPTFGRYLVEFV